jgi:hypothetical protein
MEENNMKLITLYTEIESAETNTFHCPMTGTRLLLLDHYRNNGYTAHREGFNIIVVTAPWGHAQKFALSFETKDRDYEKMCSRTSEENAKFYRAMGRVADARIENLIRFINRHCW